MKNLFIISFVFLFVACSTSEIPPLTKAEKSVAAGAALGASLGAIAGNQAGSTGGGLAIGAIAGAGIGAMVGNELREQDETIEQQKERITLQERKLQMQESELEELRRMRMDKISYKKEATFEEKNLKKTYSTVKQGVDSGEIDARASYGWENNTAGNTDFADKDVSEAKFTKPEFNTQEKEVSGFQTTECKEATKEMTQADSSNVTAEKLYHYRRALRLCPENPALHTGLSKVYIELDRKDDAKYELQEALKLDPEYAPARNLLKTI